MAAKDTKLPTPTDVKIPTISSNTLQDVIGGVLVITNILVRIWCGLYMIISDCDETFNYWEPLNLIMRGFGKQTWEYSPAYAIRSYAYLIPYYLATGQFRDLEHILGTKFPPYYFFYFIRIVCLCGFSSFTEHKLYKSVRRNYGGATANWYMLYTTFAPGMSHASVALLPSSFAMCWITLGTSSALDGLTYLNDASVVAPSIGVVACFLTAGLLGWPFTLLLALPFGLFTMAYRFQTPPLVKIVLTCIPIFTAMVAYVMLVDSHLYTRKFLFVPANIVLYNVFALEGEGPEIFGVEPFSYYVKNLLLNFNIVLPLGLLGTVANLTQKPFGLKNAFGHSVPLLIWAYIFCKQPHKEERFLYPIYPLLCLSASVLTARASIIIQEVTKLKKFIKLCFAALAAFYAVVSLLRIMNLVHNYSAPLTVSRLLPALNITEVQNVCIGREWYHFPASFFLSDNQRLRFVASGFDGLLPGDFPENVTLKQAASQYPRGMNSKNIFSSDKVVPLEVCDYYMDISLATDASKGEAQILQRVGDELRVDNSWKLLGCEKMLDLGAEQSGIGRILYIPELLRTIIPYNVAQTDFCLVQRVRKD